MDPPCKKPRTARPKKPCSLDRLSDLPDDVLHRVLSFVDFLDVVRTCVLSQRWRFVWTSMPYLNFNMDWFVKRHNYDKRYEWVDSRNKFWDFIKGALLLRDGSRIIRICLHTNNTMIGQLNALLLVAAKQKVEELCAHYGDYGFTELYFPRALCETLQMLTLSFRDRLSLRVTTNFSSLRSLSLTRVCISSDVVEKLLSSDCVELENVYLEDCRVKFLELITISARNLKNLTIVNISTFGKCWVVDGFESELRISAPKLVSFCYIGPMLRGFALLNTVSLRNASIRLLRMRQAYVDRDPNLKFCSSKFIGFDHANTLTLSTLVVKYFWSTAVNPSWDTFILDKLNHLELELRYSAKHIEGLINLLKFSPNLEGLVIRLKEIHLPRSQKKRKVIGNRSSWKSREEDIACLSNHVKIIEISNLDGTEIALELVKFLLLNGKVLEKMEIMHKSGKRRYKGFNKRVLALPKASSKVFIYFPEYAQRQIPWFDRGESDSDYDH